MDVTRMGRHDRRGTNGQGNIGRIVNDDVVSHLSRVSVEVVYTVRRRVLAWLTNGVSLLITSIKWTASLIKPSTLLGLLNRLAPYTASRLAS